jgi:regulator of telomere elongation helicase 1
VSDSPGVNDPDHDPCLPSSGLPFPVQLENQHIVTASQVWCGVLGTGPDGTSLNSSFKSRSDPKYLAALGQVIIMILKIVPKGVLIFFPSYG